MSEKFSIITTYKNQNPPQGCLYIKAYQLVRDNEKNRTLLGLSFFNGGEENIANVNVSLSYSTPNGKVKKIIPIEFPEDNVNKFFSKTLPIDEKDFTDFNSELDEIKTVSDIADIQKIEKQKDKKSTPSKKSSVIIIFTVAVLLTVVAVVLFFMPGKETTEGKGLKNITGKGTGNYDIEISTEDEIMENIVIDNAQIAAANGITDITVGDLTGEALPDILSSFIKGNFSFTGSIYSVSLAKADDVVLILSSEGYYYQQLTNGKELVQSKINNICYYINPETKEYLEVTTELMNTLNKKADDFNLKIFNTSMQKNYELYSAVINGKSGLILRVNYIDGYYDDVYYADGKVVEINTYNSEGKLTECMLPTEFTSQIPDGIMDIGTYTKNEDYEAFFEVYS